MERLQCDDLSIRCETTFEYCSQARIVPTGITHCDIARHMCMRPNVLFRGTSKLACECPLELRVRRLQMPENTDALDQALTLNGLEYHLT